jgi:multicomponent Na+:H+ antiporter subunit D
MAFIPFFIAIPLGAAFLISLAGKRFRASSGPIACAASLFLLAASLAIVKPVLAHKTLVYRVGNWLPPFGIPMIVDSLTALMLVLAGIVVFFVTIYSIGYMKPYTDKWKYYTLLMLLVGGSNGVLLAGDIFNMFVFLEIASISVYALVAYGTEKHSLEGAFKYAVMSSIGSVFIFLGIAILYSYTSTLNMADMAAVLMQKGPGMIVPFVTTLFLVGFGLKAGLMPFHAWLPDAYSAAPATVPALSSGVLIKVLGLYAISRIVFNVFGINAEVSNILVILGSLSMVGGSILAFGQTKMKRLLGYSSISQVGYIAIGLGVGTPLALFGSIFYLLNHSLSKALLFLSAGAIEHSTGTDELGSIRGTCRRSPLAGWASLVGALSISGIPPLGGFWAKLIIIFACIQAGRPMLAFLMVLASIFTLIYYFKAFTGVLFGSESEKSRPFEKALSPHMALALFCLTALVVAAGLVLLPGKWQALINGAVGVLSGGRDYAIILFGAMR